jgi:hypothetical protein
MNKLYVFTTFCVLLICSVVCGQLPIKIDDEDRLRNIINDIPKITQKDALSGKTTIAYDEAIKEALYHTHKIIDKRFNNRIVEISELRWAKLYWIEEGRLGWHFCFGVVDEAKMLTEIEIYVISKGNCIPFIEEVEKVAREESKGSEAAK